MNPLTQQVKYELNRALPPASGAPSTHRAQSAAMIRFGGGLFTRDGRTWIDAELDTREAALWLRDEITRLFDAEPRAFALETGAFKVRQIHQAKDLAIQVGLLSPSGLPVLGMAPAVVTGTRVDAAAALRGAFLAKGHIATHKHRRPRLEVVCPTAPAAMALIGFARRHGVRAQMRTYLRNGAPVETFEVRDTLELRNLLVSMGAPQAAQTMLNSHCPSQLSGNRNGLDAANRSRFTQAAQEQAASVRRALQILGNDLPPQLAEVAKLRLANPTTRISELAAKADPPITKDAFAGRMWRLLQRAEERAKPQGVDGVA